jgi:Holliday junction resolvase RusA-like endonuclease
VERGRVTEILTFDVLGRPAPQGSKRAVRVGNTVRLLEQSKRVQPYRQAVAASAIEALHDTDDALRARLLTHPLWVVVTFLLARPQGHYRTGRHYPLLRPAAPARPAVAPDLDKLCRAALDGLTMSGAIRDDAQVVSLIAHERYAHPGAPERTLVEVKPLARTVEESEQEAAAA